MILAAASLVLVVAAVTLWVRSYWISDILGISRSALLSTDRGDVVLFVAERDGNFTMSLGYSREELPDPNETLNPRRVSNRTWDLLVAHGEEFPGLRITVVRLWAITVVVALPLALLLFRLHRGRRRVVRDLCATCGYDLRATPARCPECGAVPEGATRTNCYGCHYDLRGSDGRCPECGRPFQRCERASYSRYSLAQWRALKALDAIDHWGVYLAALIGCGIVVAIFDNLLFRLGMAAFAWSILHSLIRRVRKGPVDWERLHRESAR